MWESLKARDDDDQDPVMKLRWKEVDRLKLEFGAGNNLPGSMP